MSEILLMMHHKLTILALVMLHYQTVMLLSRACSICIKTMFVHQKGPWSIHHFVRVYALWYSSFQQSLLNQH